MNEFSQAIPKQLTEESKVNKDQQQESKQDAIKVVSQILDRQIDQQTLD